MEQKPSKRHLRFDAAHAARIYADTSLDGKHISSPFHLYSVETLRKKHNLTTGEAFPADIFVFGKGSPPDPRCTKVSGLPFWPANEKWPTNEAGEPLRFVAQLNFEDSTDLFPDLPGDLLLLFVENDDSEDWLWDEESVHFKWLRTKSVIPVNAFPAGVKPYAESEFYGVIHRSADYEDADVETLEVSQSYLLPILSGTKIGGRPSYIQAGEDPERTFLAQIGSIQAAPQVKFPWTNSESPLTLDFDGAGIGGDTNQCMFSDLGSVYIFIDEDGKCHTSIDSY